MCAAMVGANLPDPIRRESQKSVNKCNRDFTGAADKAVNLVGCKSSHQLPGRVVSISDACGGNEACSART